jgi:aerotaxis receptor
MRVNLPVSNIEYPLDDEALLVSTTDAKGRITYVNPAFLEVSGYSEDELLGRAHNIIRHPDMPPEAFADFWKILQSGKPWTGFVKNRRKNGDYYWVLANATPLVENGRITGYLSVRTKPSRELVEKVEPIYRQIRDGKARNLKIENGGIVRTDFTGKVATLFRITFTKRAALFLSLPTLLLACAAGAGWWGINQAITPPGLSHFILTAAITGVLSMGAMGHCLVRSVLKPLNDAVDVTNTFAAGNLGARISAAYHDEFGLLFKSLSQMNLNLKATILDINNNAEMVRQAAGEIASGNMDLSKRTEEQASSLEETAASMEQLASTVKQNSENAKQADQLATDASHVALKGGQLMANVVTTMTSISDSSKNIANIINVINGVAFQTNILALNAAVEAARAGEQGKGFAVVATEVRNLAQRSAAAAKEIKSLIDDSVKRIENGTLQVNDAGKTMQEIVNSVKHVADIMTEITAASQEQSSGIDQVNQAVMQMDEVTQQNAALVEEAAAAAESLEQQARELTGAISIFKVGHSAVSDKANVLRLDGERSGDRKRDFMSSTHNQSRIAGKKVVNSNETWNDFERN